MIEVRDHRREIAGALFMDYQWNYLAEAILEDRVVSRAWVDDLANPQVGVLELSQISLCLAGGEATHLAARSWVQSLSPWTAVVPAAEGWEALLQQAWGEVLQLLPRWAFTSEALDPVRLAALRAQIPKNYRLARMDAGLTRQLMLEESEFSNDHLLNYASQQDFLGRGFGFCILEGERIVSVATTFVTCARGIEIQINTRKSHRGQGLGTAVAAAILLYSLEHGLDPSWDAASEVSASLALKLGYTPQGTYSMYYLPGEVEVG